MQNNCRLSCFLNLIKKIFLILIFMFCLFAIFAYYKKLTDTQELTCNGLNHYFLIITYFIPSVLYVYLGNLYIKTKIVRRTPFLDKLKLFLWSLVFFFSGLLISMLTHFIADLIFGIFCMMYGFNSWPLPDLSSPIHELFDCVFSSITALVLYQMITEKSIKTKS